jgi:hypothetical protein
MDTLRAKDSFGHAGDYIQERHVRTPVVGKALNQPQAYPKTCWREGTTGRDESRKCPRSLKSNP